ncbi:F-box domain-containing protein [Mycena sanguinolenta]|uniref:F-box domain-containing protein n=1 Tax=Mycena sanguinolenta TaxID=230812 RepID=A0A8H6XY15_9AGAR|nr:F-box domain-containing protein [Mycena sanguinolenta]
MGYPLGSLNTVVAFTVYKVTPHHSRCRPPQALQSAPISSNLDEPFNPQKTYPVLTLPPEIVAEIFAHWLPNYPECPPPRGILSPLLLCQICRQWRMIALSTPILWRAISVELRRGDSEKRLAAELELLKTWLKRSGDCPLSISLAHSRNITHRLVPQFLRAIVAHRQRWEHVDLLMPFEYMHLIHGNMPLLRNLTFGPSNYPHGRARFPDLFHDAPHLRRVILTRNFFKSFMALPWAQLTHVEADCLYEHECIDILREAPLLVACTFRVCSGASVPQSDVLTHTCLRDLILDKVDESSTPPRLWMVLDCLMLPALRSLQIDAPFVTLEAISMFIARSHCFLEDLRIIGTSLSRNPHTERRCPHFLHSHLKNE